MTALTAGPHSEEMEGSRAETTLSIIVAMDRSGVMRIYAASKSMNLIGSPTLGEAVEATPAFRDGAIFVRGVRNLFCIRAGAR